MSLLTAYLSRPSTQRILSKKPGQEGFSLIELVVVIAVLAVLTAIALPNFLGVSNDATGRAAQQAAITAFKECSVAKARGTLTANASFKNPAITGYYIYATDNLKDDATDLGTQIGLKPATQADVEVNKKTDKKASTSCFTGDGSKDGTLRDIVAVSAIKDEFPTFKVSNQGDKVCMTGDPAIGKTTFNIGCDGTTKNKFNTAWK